MYECLWLQWYPLSDPGIVSGNCVVADFLLLNQAGLEILVPMWVIFKTVYFSLLSFRFCLSNLSVLCAEGAGRAMRRRR